MNNQKIMAAGNLEDIMGRLICFNALLNTIRLAMDDDEKMVDSMSSASDLLTCICRDFQADIDAAEDYTNGVKAISMRTEAATA